MKKISTFNLTKLHNNEHAQFHLYVNNEIVKTTPEKLGIEKYNTAYTEAITAEQTAIDVELGSHMTTVVSKKNKARGKVYYSFILNNKSSSLSSDEDVVQSAKRIKRIIVQVGKVRRLNYHDQSEAITSLLTQLRTNYATDIARCNASGILDKLEAANNDFIQTYGARATESSEKPSGNVSNARVTTDRLFKDIVTIVNARILTTDDIAVSGFIDLINLQIDYYKTTLLTRKNKRKKNDDTENKAE